MAVPRLDPRVSKDRIYEYADYKMLSTQFRKRAADRAQQRWSLPHPSLQARRRPMRLTYGVLIGFAAAVILACIAFAVYLESDSLRLAYKEQDLKVTLASLDQAVAEAHSQNLGRESRVLAEGAVPQGVVYPARTKYIVLTNIPAVQSGSLVADIYPLSRKLIKIQP
jgi:hypothetical protein